MPTSGQSADASLSAAGAGASASVAVLGSTPSTALQPVALFVDGAGHPLDIDAAGDPLLVRAGVTWSGKTAAQSA